VVITVTRQQRRGAPDIANLEIGVQLQGRWSARLAENNTITQAVINALVEAV
jgi:uncharacterized protein YggE